MKNPSRALRRHHRARMIRRALRTERIRWRYYPTFGESPYSAQRISDIREVAARSFNHLASCSCSMCGNQRNNRWLNEWERMTLQERNAVNAYKDDVEDLTEIEDNDPHY